jgi:hypothetical protein
VPATDAGFEELCSPRALVFGWFFSGLGFERWPAFGRDCFGAFRVEPGSAGVFSSCWAGRCGATNSNNKKIANDRVAKAHILRQEFMASPIGPSDRSNKLVRSSSIASGPEQSSVSEFPTPDTIAIARPRRRTLLVGFREERRAEAFRNADASEIAHGLGPNPRRRKREYGAKADTGNGANQTASCASPF